MEEKEISLSFSIPALPKFLLKAASLFHFCHNGTCTTAIARLFHIRVSRAHLMSYSIPDRGAKGKLQKKNIRTPCCFHDGGHKANFLRNRNTGEEKPTRACSGQEGRALNKCDRHSRRRKPNKETTLRAANSIFPKGDEEVFSRWFCFHFQELN